MDDLKKMIREVPDFPKKGILFYDITTLLKDKVGFRKVIDALTEPWPGPEAMPDAELRRDLLIAWYGAPEAPALWLGGLSPG